MGGLLVKVLGWMFRKLGMLFAIVVVLIAANYFRQEWEKYQQMRESLDLALQLDRDTSGKSVQGRLYPDGLPGIQLPVEAVAKRRVELEILRGKKSSEKAELKRKASLLDSLNPRRRVLELALDIELDVLRQAIDHLRETEILIRDLAKCAPLTPPVNCAVPIAQLRASIAQLNAQIANWNGQIQAIKKANPLAANAGWTSKGTCHGTAQYVAICNMEKSIDSNQTSIGQANYRITLLQAILGKANGHAFRPKIDKQELHAFIKDKELALSENWVHKAMQPVRDQLLPALGILAAIIFTPFLVRAAIWIVAGWSRRRRGLVLLPGPAPVVRMAGATTACNLALVEGMELLVHPGYPLGKSAELRSSARALLDWSKPLLSLASGMYYLTRLCAQGRGMATVSVPEHDPLIRLAAVDLEEETSLVVRPRYLVGIVQRIDAPMKITTHWRLFSATSWMSMQFRFVVFHGPGTLVLKGCQGVDLQMVESGSESNRHAMIGFTANLAYGVVRHADFWPYVFGHANLGGERFSGARGFVVSGAVPLQGSGSGGGKGLPFWLDALLKPFGL